MRKVILNDLKSSSNIIGIYKLDFPNGKSYIGQSQNIFRRISEHNRYAEQGHGTHNLQLCEKAIQKYGLIQDFIILEENIPINKLDEKEAYWIKFYNTTNREKGYNITQGGDVSGKRGCFHPNSSFTEKELNEIYDLLINHPELSYIDISNKYGVSQMCIYRISKGYSYINENLIYPLRQDCHSFNLKNNILDYFKNEEELLNLKEDLLYRWDLTIEKDLVQKYNIPLKVLREINKGTKFQDYGNYSYPIRKKNTRNFHNFNQQDILDILNDLKHSSLSMTEIGKKYNIHRDTVSRINKGTNFIIKNYKYPARIT